MSPELTEKLSIAIEGMPAFPKSVRKILELTRHLECSPKELIQVIEKDPVVTVKVLRVVNVAYYNPPKPITSISQAVVYLGFNSIKQLALIVAAIGILPARSACGFDTARFLFHSLSTAGLAKQLALRVEDTDPMDCFVAGLLHDFGKMVLAQFMPAEFQKALEHGQRTETSLRTALHEVTDADTAEIGALLLEKWNFSRDMVETIRFQHRPNLKDTPMVACVFAANQISKKLESNFSGYASSQELPSGVAQRLGGTLDEVIASMGDLTPVFEEASLFSRI
jgi:HD-like signal output (HDOD) protein